MNISKIDHESEATTAGRKVARRKTKAVLEAENKAMRYALERIEYYQRHLESGEPTKLGNVVCAHFFAGAVEQITKNAFETVGAA